MTKEEVVILIKEHMPGSTWRTRQKLLNSWQQTGSFMRTKLHWSYFGFQKLEAMEQILQEKDTMTPQELSKKLVDAEAILRDLVKSIECIGVEEVLDEMNWYDLHSIYTDACAFLGVTPQEPEKYDDEEKDN